MQNSEQLRATVVMLVHAEACHFWTDGGTVSAAYHTLGTGMHAGLPGHGFVLINAAGKQVWQGNYPSMWLQPEDLLAEVRKRL